MLNFANNGDCVFSSHKDFFDVNLAAKNCWSDLGNRLVLLAQIRHLKQLSYTRFPNLMNEYISFWKFTQHVLDYALLALYNYILDLRKKIINIYFQFIKIIIFV